MRWSLDSFLRVLALVFLAFPAFADVDIYRLEGVTIARTVSETAAAPQGNLREAAMQEILTTGYRQFLQQITPQAYWMRHTWLMAELPARQAITQVSITREETFPAYELEVALQFDREAIRQLLTGQNVPFHETPPARVLLIPVYELGNLQLLWEENNPWREAIQRTLLQQGGLQYTLPAGDIEEVRMLTASMAVAGATDVLETFQTSYDVDAVVVSRLQVRGQGIFAQLVVENQWFHTRGGELVGEAVAPVQLPAMGGQVTPQALADAALQAYETLETHWRAGRTIMTAEQGTVFLRLAAQAPGEVNVLREKLQGLPTVSRVLPRLIRQGEVRMQVDFFGRPEQLADALRGAGLGLERRPGGWDVTLPPAEAAPAADVRQLGGNRAEFDETVAPLVEPGAE